MPTLILGIGKKKKPFMPPPKAPGGKADGPPKAGLIIGVGPAGSGEDEKPDATPRPAGEEATPGDYAEVKPRPDAVGYRTSQQTCGRCSHMGDDGQCNHPMVAMAVSPGDSCLAFEAKGGEAEEANPNEAEPDNDADDLTGGR